MLKLTGTIFASVLLAAVGSSALAEPRPGPVRGTVENYQDGLLKVTTRSGDSVSVSLSKKLQIVGVINRKLDDIKLGEYVSSSAAQVGDGKFEALQISILPAAMRGMNEGQRPWDVVPGSVMTNATIVGTATPSDADHIKLKYGEKEITLDVPAKTPIVSFVPGDQTLLKSGASVFLVAMKKDDGSLETGWIVAEKDGVKPPM